MQFFKKSALIILCILSQIIFATNDIKQALSSAMPAVVQIIIEPKKQFAMKMKKNIKESRKIGSGVILNAKEGIIITNSHLTHIAQNIIVTLNDGRHFIGRVLGEDKATDLAVIKIKPNNLKEISTKSKKPSIGDYVIAIGNPYGLSQSVTRGVISGFNRHIGLEGVENFIQTDAPINPGNSGGALVDNSGNLIGINTAILSTTGSNIGLGFAIPMSIVEPIAKQILKYGNIKRGMIGIISQNMNQNLAQTMQSKYNKGALITQVLPNSPAEKSGLKENDIIIALNKTPIKTSAEVKNLVAVVRVGEPATMSIIRDNKLLEIKVSPSDKIPKEKKDTNLLNGISIEKSDVISINGKHIQGAKVLAVKSGTPAWLSGIQKSDLITEINRKKFKSLERLLKSAKTKKMLLLTILRHNQKLLLVLND